MKTISKMKFGSIIKTFAIFMMVSLAHNAYASTTGSDLPWNTSLETVESWLSGSIAHWAVIIAISASGLAFAFGEQGGIFRKGAAIVLGGSIAAGAAQIAMALSLAGAII